MPETTLSQFSLLDFDAESNPKDIIAWALEQHPDLIMPSAFNINGIVLMDFAAQAGYTGEVVFVDTGYHFPETLDTYVALEHKYSQFKFVTLNAHLEDTQQYLVDTDACCAVRKVAPLQDYLAQKNPSALLNGRSKDQADTRANIDFVEQGKRKRINPLAYWTREMLEGYAKEHELPVNPMYWDGFLSIGCWPCTRAVRPGEDARAGRWAGQAKTECGLWVGEKAL